MVASSIEDSVNSSSTNMSEYDLDMRFEVVEFGEYCRQEVGIQQYKFELKKNNK
ncbi:hypothetical protein CI610_03027 [invertebrate metagenome]|uniref:Uncharacterized protein n=1 Tax=invertebrate metagenome TaxID=1711999 RepID=A0A2H9T491_9ZZZZ